MWHTGSFVVARRIFFGACGLLSSCRTWAPGHVGSVVVAHGLSVEAHGLSVEAHELSSCGVWA